MSHFLILLTHFGGDRFSTKAGVYLVAFGRKVSVLNKTIEEVLRLRRKIIRKGEGKAIPKSESKHENKSSKKYPGCFSNYANGHDCELMGWKGSWLKKIRSFTFSTIAPCKIGKIYVKDPRYHQGVLIPKDRMRIFYFFLKVMPFALPCLRMASNMASSN